MTGVRRGLAVEDAGLLTTVQDTGRWGYQHYGVSVSGAMDLNAHRRANRLVGNPPEAATLEITLVGPVLRFETAMRVGVAGAVFELQLGGCAVSTDTVLNAERPARPSRSAGARRGRGRTSRQRAVSKCHPCSGAGPRICAAAWAVWRGRPLKAGDRLGVGPLRGVPCRESAATKWKRCMPCGGARVRILPGPHAGLFDPLVLRRLESARYTIRPESDRMGYRLDGAPIAGPDGLSLLSQGFPIGAVQVVPSGDVIVAMADRQTAGGYPRVATVIAADIPVLAQLAPRDWVEFDRCDHRTAREALMQSESDREST